MGWLEDLENKVSDYLDGDYDITDIDFVPNIDNVGFGKKAYRTKMVTFCIDLRHSSDLLVLHQKQTSGKIHKAFLTIVVKTLREYGADIRSFQGDSVLAFWPANYKSQICNAVTASMVLIYILNTKLSKYFETYEKLDFGIGLDFGEVLIIRAGLTKDPNNNDLVFIGKSVNFAVAIANQASAPCQLEISQLVYDNLDDDHIFDNNRNNMWRNCYADWNNKRYETKGTSYYWKIA